MTTIRARLALFALVLCTWVTLVAIIGGGVLRAALLLCCGTLLAAVNGLIIGSAPPQHSSDHLRRLALFELRVLTDGGIVVLVLMLAVHLVS